MKNSSPKKLVFTSIVWRENKHFIAQCLNVDVSSFGKTKKESLTNLEEALELYLEGKPKKILKIDSPSIEVRELQCV